VPDHAQIRQRGETLRLQLLGLLACKLFLKLVCTGLAAEVIRLPPDFFRYCRSSGNKYQTDGILYHVIFSRRELIRFAPLLDPPDGSDGAPNKKVQYNKKPDGDENSIHSGRLF